MKGQGLGGFVRVRVGEASHLGPASSVAQAYKSLDDVPFSVRYTFVHLEPLSSQRSLRRVVSDPSGHGSGVFEQEFVRFDINDTTPDQAAVDDGGH
jgi:hypothetical protein